MRVASTPEAIIYILRYSVEQIKRRKVLRLIQIRLTALSLRKSRLLIKHNRRKHESPFQFHKSSQLFIRPYNETLFIVEMRINNEIPPPRAKSNAAGFLLFAACLLVQDHTATR
jgi:hypothetical protein